MACQIPPKALRYLLSGSNDTRSSFFEMGRHCAQRIVEALKRINAEINEFRRHPRFWLRMWPNQSDISVL